jgi:hypothetical protein
MAMKTYTVLTTEQIIGRLKVLASKLEGDGAYVGMITCDVAIARLEELTTPKPQCSTCGSKDVVVTLPVARCEGCAERTGTPFSPYRKGC